MLFFQDVLNLCVQPSWVGQFLQLIFQLTQPYLNSEKIHHYLGSGGMFLSLSEAESAEKSIAGTAQPN